VNQHSAFYYLTAAKWETNLCSRLFKLATVNAVELKKKDLYDYFSDHGLEQQFEF